MMIIEKFVKSIKKNQTTFFITIIIILGLLSYINIYDNKFLWDDEFLVQKNVFITDFKYIPTMFVTCSGAGVGRLDNFYRPMQVLSYSIIYHLTGAVEWSYHLLNVFLHVTNGLLIFFLLRKITKKDFVAFLTSILWIVHPIHTEAITYMNGTADPMSLFFALIAFLFYIKRKETTKLYYLILSFLFFIFALLSKESIIVFPGIIFIYELINSKKEYSKYKDIIAMFLVSIIYFYIRNTYLDFGGTLNMFEQENIYTQNITIRVFTFLAALIQYYGFLLFPHNLHMERSFPIFINLLNVYVISSIFILVLVAWLCYRSFRQKKNYYIFAISWFFISFIPMSGILIPVNSLLLEHWLYTPSIGFFLLISLSLERLLKDKKLWLLIGIIVIILMSLTLNRNLDWKDPITFYNNILTYEEGTIRVHNNLAMAYVDNNQYDLAEKHYLKSILINDINAEPHYNLARLYLSQNKISEAKYHLEKSIKINPNFFYSYYLLSEIYKYQGNLSQSEEYFNIAKSIQYY